MESATELPGPGSAQTNESIAICTAETELPMPPTDEKTAEPQPVATETEAAPLKTGNEIQDADTNAMHIDAGDSVFKQADVQTNMDTENNTPVHGETANTEATVVEAVTTQAADNVSTSEHIEPAKEAEAPEAAGQAFEDTSEAPHLTDALEAALNGMMDVDEATVPPAGEEQQQEDGNEEEAAEWEADSSPYESSSDSDSSDDSSSDDDDEAALPSMQEAVRMMMQSAMDEDDDDDDEEGRRGGGGGHLRSKNEQPEAVPPKPDVTIGPDDEIVLLGSILHVVENSAVIKGNTDGTYRVLDVGSVLCKADRTVVGIVADIIGNVRGPLYVLRFAPKTEEANAEQTDGTSGVGVDNLSPGQDLYYPPQHAHFVFTEELRGQKGSDASNLHDEEVAMDEMEFSDDEKEMAYKRELKTKRRENKAGGDAGSGGRGRANRGGRGGNKTGGAGGHPLRNEIKNDSSGGIRYEEEEDDGPYKRLARPANFGQGQGAPQSQAAPRNNGDSHGSFRGGSSRGYRGGGGRGNRSHRDRGGGFARGRGGYGGGSGGGSGSRDGYARSPPHRYGVSSSQPQAPPPSVQSAQAAQPAQAATPWSYSGFSYPPPPPPPQYTAGAGLAPSGTAYSQPPAAPSSVAAFTAAAAMLNQFNWQQQQQQQQQPLQAQQQQQSQHQQQQVALALSQAISQSYGYAPPPPPQQQPQQQQRPASGWPQAPPQPAATTSFNPAAFSYYLQGQGQGQPGWGQGPPPSS